MKTGSKKNPIPSKLPNDFSAGMSTAFQNSGYPDTCLTNWECVAKMETAGFTSDLYNSYNNPWGMRDATGRINTQKGVILSGNGSFGTYWNVADACADIVNWMNAAGFPPTSMSLADHVAKMKDFGYFDESVDGYLAVVNEWVNA